MAPEAIDRACVHQDVPLVDASGDGKQALTVITGCMREIKVLTESIVALVTVCFWNTKGIMALGMDALVTVCSWNTNGIMHRMLLEHEGNYGFGHGCSGHCMFLEHEGNYGFGHGCSGLLEHEGNNALGMDIDSAKQRPALPFTLPAAHLLWLLRRLLRLCVWRVWSKKRHKRVYGFTAVCTNMPPDLPSIT